MMSHSQEPRRRKSSLIWLYKIHLGGKVRVKLQRIRPGVRWPSARIDIIDSLSAFYVENRDPRIYSKYETMSEDLQ